MQQIAKELSPDIVEIYQKTFLSATIAQFAFVMADNQSLLCIGDILDSLASGSKLLLVICKFQLLQHVQGVLQVCVLPPSSSIFHVL